MLGLQFQCTRFRGSPWCWAVWEIEICKNSPGMWRSFTSTKLGWNNFPTAIHHGLLPYSSFPIRIWHENITLPNFPFPPKHFFQKYKTNEILLTTSQKSMSCILFLHPHTNLILKRKKEKKKKTQISESIEHDIWGKYNHQPEFYMVSNKTKVG